MGLPATGFLTKEEKTKLTHNFELDRVSKSAKTYTSQQQAQRSKRFQQNNPNSDNYVSGASAVGKTISTPGTVKPKTNTATKNMGGIIGTVPYSPKPTVNNATQVNNFIDNIKMPNNFIQQSPITSTVPANAIVRRNKVIDFNPTYGETKKQYEARRNLNPYLPEWGTQEHLKQRENELYNNIIKIDAPKTMENRDILWAKQYEKILKGEININSINPDLLNAYKKSYEQYNKMQKANVLRNEYSNTLSALRSFENKGVKLTKNGEVDTKKGISDAEYYRDLADKGFRITGTNADFSPSNRNDNMQRIMEQGELANEKIDAYEYYDENKDNYYNGLIGRLLGNSKVGRIGIKSNTAGYTAMKTNSNDLEANDVYSLLTERIVNRNKETFTNRNKFEEGLAIIGQYIPQGIDQAKNRIVGNLLGGAVFGNAYASGLNAKYIYEQTSGSSYVRQLQENGLSPEDARKLAENEAIASAIIEFGLDFAVGKIVEGGKKVGNFAKETRLGEVAKSGIKKTEKFLSNSLAKIGIKKDAQKVILNTSKKVAKGFLESFGEGMEEWIQEGMSITSDRLSKDVKNGKEIDNLSTFSKIFFGSFDLSKYSKEDFSRMNEALVGGMLIGFMQGTGSKILNSTSKNIAQKMVDNTNKEIINKLVSAMTDEGRQRYLKTVIELGEKSEDKKIKKLTEKLKSGKSEDYGELALLLIKNGKNPFYTVKSNGDNPEATTNPILSSLNKAVSGDILTPKEVNDIILSDNGKKAFYDATGIQLGDNVNENRAIVNSYIAAQQNKATEQAKIEPQATETNLTSNNTTETENAPQGELEFVQGSKGTNGYVYTPDTSEFLKSKVDEYAQILEYYAMQNQDVDGMVEANRLKATSKMIKENKPILDKLSNAFDVRIVAQGTPQFIPSKNGGKPQLFLTGRDTIAHEVAHAVTNYFVGQNSKEYNGLFKKVVESTIFKDYVADEKFINSFTNAITEALATSKSKGGQGLSGTELENVRAELLRGRTIEEFRDILKIIYSKYNSDEIGVGENFDENKLNKIVDDEIFSYAMQSIADADIDTLNRMFADDKTALQKFIQFMRDFWNDLVKSFKGESQMDIQYEKEARKMADKFNNLYNEMVKGDETIIDLSEQNEKNYAENNSNDETSRANLQSNESREDAKSARITKDRLDYLINDSGAGTKKDYAQKWITSINPTDFINMTTSKTQDREIFDKTKGDYGSTVDEYDYIEGLKKETRQTPFLYIDTNGNVIGHEGRHRMRALEKNGVKSCDVVIEFRDEDGFIIKNYNDINGRLETVPSIKISNQYGTNQSTELNNIIPINLDHKEEILKSYTETNAEDDDIRYNLQDFDINDKGYRDQESRNRANAKKELYSQFQVPKKNRTELNGQMKAIFEAVEKGKDVSETTKKHLFKLLTEYSEVVDDEWAKQNKDFIDYFKGKTLKVSNEIASEFDNWKSLFGQVAGKFKVSSTRGEGIDAIYQEALELFPDMLDEDIWNSSDQLKEIISVLNSMKPTKTDIISSAKKVGGTEEEFIQILNEILEEHRVKNDILKINFGKDISNKELKWLTDNYKSDVERILDIKLGNDAVKTIKNLIRDVQNDKFEISMERIIGDSRREKALSDDADYISMLEEEAGDVGIDVTETEKYLINTLKNINALDYNTDITRVLDKMAGKSKLAREFLYRLIEKPMYEAKDKWTANLKNKVSEYGKVMKGLGIKIGSKESSAVQWYGEGVKEDGSKYTLEDLKKDFPTKWQNIVEADKYNRQIYDNYIKEVNDALIEVYPYVEKLVEKKENKIQEITDYIADKDDKIRKKGLEAIKALERDIDTLKTNKRLTPRKDYYRHFNELSQGIKGLIENVQNVTDIDPKLVGTSENTKPLSKWWSALRHRTNKGKYKADAYAAMMDYMYSAETKIAFDPIIANLRRIVRTFASEREDTGFNNSIKWLQEYTNSIAGKTNFIDRPLQALIGRNAYTKTLDFLNGKTKSNALGWNVRSAIVQFANIPNAAGYVKNPLNWAKGLKDYTTDFLGSLLGIEHNSEIENSVFLRERYLDSFLDKYTAPMTILNSPKKFANFLLEFGDREASKLIWYSAFEQGKKLKSVKNPYEYADNITRKSVGGRGIGEVPIMQQAKLTKLLAPFQVETTNQFNLWREKFKEKDLLGMLMMVVSGTIMAEIYKFIFGDSPTFDYYGTYKDIAKNFKEDGSLTSKIGKSIGRIGGEIVSNMPFGSLITQTFVPDEDEREKIFGSADPTRFGTGTIGAKALFDSAKGLYNISTKALNNELTTEGFIDDVMPLLSNYILPTGGKQLQRSYKGYKDIKKEGAYTSKGNLKYPVTTKEDKFRTALFGSSTTDEGKKYSENPVAFSDKNTQIYDYITQNYKTSKQTTYETIKELSNYRKFLGKSNLSKKDIEEYFDRTKFAPKIKEEFINLYSNDDYYKNKILGVEVKSKSEKKYEKKEKEEQNEKLRNDYFKQKK